eukprot:TRINITY_DN1609_c0_g3_i1.p1 TRINITY_DN1609_c0_g3~~TRINITY_DN1609_c0_g3_i1.p1  ORF type:complete len:175 (+),score=31.07 TRINITY_DN1609_c0_g3_i1:70-594(+)
MGSCSGKEEGRRGSRRARSTDEIGWQPRAVPATVEHDVRGVCFVKPASGRTMGGQPQDGSLPPVSALGICSICGIAMPRGRAHVNYEGLRLCQECYATTVAPTRRRPPGLQRLAHGGAQQQQQHGGAPATPMTHPIGGAHGHGGFNYHHQSYHPPQQEPVYWDESMDGGADYDQ